MALSIGNVCLPRNFNMFLKNKHVFIFPLTNSVRHLRGSRYGREMNKAEAKFQELMKNLKRDSKSTEISSSEIPELVIKSITPKEVMSTLPSDNDLPLTDIHTRLEEKVTPFRKMEYKRQLEKKYKKCLSLLRMFGQKLKAVNMPIVMGPDLLPCPVDIMLPSPVTEGYRNQDEFSIGKGLDGSEKTVGFYLGSPSGDSHICLSPDDLIIIKTCHKEFLKDFQNFIRQSSLPASIHYDDDGYWKSVIIRSNAADEVMGIITMKSQQLTEEELEEEKKKLQEYFTTIEKTYSLKSLYLQTCTTSHSNKEPAPFELILGSPCITEELNGMKFQISPESYFYSNSQAAEGLYRSVKKLCKVNDAMTVVDVLCGTGSLSLLFSPHVKRCIGIDNSSQAIQDAKANALLNNQHNVEFIHGHPDNHLKEILYTNFHSDLLAVINPSKIELSKGAVKSLRECKYLKKIVYITTKPEANVDNFVRLCRPAGGDHHLGKYFVPIYAIPVDLSPQTKRFGLIVMFQRL